MNRILLAVVTMGILFNACNTTKPLPSTETTKPFDTSICEFKATMLDFTSNENCQYLFQLEDGSKLLPATMPQVDIPFYDRNIVLIGYKSVNYDASKTNTACGKEDKIVEITCIRQYEEANTSPKTHDDCQPVKNLFKTQWMRDAVEDTKPQKVFEYDYTVGYLYLFKAQEKATLYDCLGNKMCDTDDGGDCSSLIETLGEAKLIQVLKN